MTLEEFKKNHPDVANAYKTEILADTKDNAGANTQAAVDTERARIKAIDDMTLPGFEDLANKAKYEEPVTAEAFAMQIITEQKKTGQCRQFGSKRCYPDFQQRRTGRRQRPIRRDYRPDVSTDKITGGKK